MEKKAEQEALDVGRAGENVQSKAGLNTLGTS